jgi:hypothetical protein
MCRGREKCEHGPVRSVNVALGPPIGPKSASLRVLHVRFGVYGSGAAGASRVAESTSLTLGGTNN